MFIFTFVVNFLRFRCAVFYSFRVCTNALYMLSQNRQMLTTASGYPSLFPTMASGYKSLYLDREDLNQEQVRLSTFVCWPRWTPKSITRESMARSGLHFTGDGDVVKCFSCKVVLANWKEGDDPLDRHRRQSPHCDFLKQILCNSDDLVVDGESAAAECDNEDYGDDEVDGATTQSHQENNVIESLEPLESLHMGNSCSVLTQKTKSNSSGKYCHKYCHRR